MELKKKVPEVRFKGFSGEWEELFLGNVSDIKTGPFGSTLHADDYVKDGEPIITTEHFKLGNLPNNKEGIPQVCENDYVRLKAYLLKSGDIVFSRVGSIDINAHVKKIHDGWLFSGRVLRVRTTETVDSEYLHHELFTSRVRKSVISRAVGQTMPSINTEILRNTLIQLPKNTTEQSRIGTWFQHLDQLITLHQKKYNKLTNIKKAMFEKMFPKNGADVPEIRFEGFEGKWEEQELGHVVKITMGQSPNGINYTDNPEDFILVQGNADMKNGEVVPRVWTKQVTKTADAEDIVFSVRAPVGEVGKTSYNIVIGRGVAAIRGDEFVFQLLKRMNGNGYWKRFSAGSTFDSINSNELSKALILLTVDEEQQKIGTYFQKLDQLITLQQTQIDKLKTIKKACLEKMFV